MHKACQKPCNSAFPMQKRRLRNHCLRRRLEQAFYAAIPIESQGVLAQVALLVQRGESLLQIPNDILGVLGTDGKTDRGGRDVLLLRRVPVCLPVHRAVLA